jgi:hypothetical protein
MRRAVVLVLACLLVVACRGGEGGTIGPSPSGASGASSGDGVGEPLVIRTKLTVAAVEGAETIATGEVLEGSMMGDSAFCVGGTVLDVHADPAEAVDALIERTITCRAGTVTLGITPVVGASHDPQDLTQTGAWTIIRGSGAFDGLGGQGEMEMTYGPGEGSAVHETLTGTVIR